MDAVLKILGSAMIALVLCSAGASAQDKPSRQSRIDNPSNSGNTSSNGKVED